MARTQKNLKARRSVFSHLFRLSAVIVGVVLFVGFLGFFVIQAKLEESLPIVDGQLTVSALSAPVQIDRDSRGVPIIRAANQDDAVIALGFLHAQERFFQMDLKRRVSSGRLAQLLGPRLLNRDIRTRTMQLDESILETLELLPNRQRELIKKYTDGVNAGLEALGSPPPEYLLLRVKPEPWEELDCVRVLMTMMLDLSNNSSRDIQRAAMSDFLHPELYAALSPDVTSLDAPILGEQEPLPAIPSASSFDWRESENVFPRSRLWRAVGRRAPLNEEEENLPLEEEPHDAASNAWAVSGEHTHHGGAIIAGDMHLRLTLPMSWYHAQLEWGGGGWSHQAPPESEAVYFFDNQSQSKGQFVGLTNPGGLPLFVGGSNGFIAFAFTNLHADLADLVFIEQVAEQDNNYLTAEGSEPFRIESEIIEVRGEEPHHIQVRITHWGPVIGEDHRGRPVAFQWIGHYPEAVSGESFDLISARTIEDAAAIGARAGGPPMNMTVADRHGSVGWLITGYLPDRIDDSRAPVIPGVDPNSKWKGVTAKNKPMAILNPMHGTVFNANNRSLSLQAWSVVGSQPSEPDRAHRIQQQLQSLLGSALKQQTSELEMHELQFDTYANRYTYIRDSVPRFLRSAGDDRLLALAEMLESWDGSASSGSSAYRMVRLLSLTFEADIIGGLFLEGSERVLGEATKSSIRVRNRDFVRRLLAERPNHLIPPGYQSWEEYIVDAARYALRAARKQTPRLGEQTPWGELNRLRIAHPLNSAIPNWLIADRLKLPEVPQSGDRGTVLVAGSTFGSSNRIVVSPGREHLGFLELPGGQSGHYLSQNFQDRFEIWRDPAQLDSLLAEPAIHSLRLTE